RYGPGKFNLNDQGYVARVHPLELWLLGYLQKQPQATFGEAVAASGASCSAISCPRSINWARMSDSWTQVK
uniref:hypothetical protein n=1 Tax=Salmonella sp. M265 TaxID=3240301 RepID=UPI00352A84B7